jgi:hypothetical protein
MRVRNAFDGLQWRHGLRGSVKPGGPLEVRWWCINHYRIGQRKGLLWCDSILPSQGRNAPDGRSPGPLEWRVSAQVCILSTLLPLVWGLTAFGLARIPHVSARSQCFQGLEYGSSPTLGTHSPSLEGVLLLRRVRGSSTGPLRLLICVSDCLALLVEGSPGSPPCGECEECARPSCVA